MVFTRPSLHHFSELISLSFSFSQCIDQDVRAKMLALVEEHGTAYELHFDCDAKAVRAVGELETVDPFIRLSTSGIRSLAFAELGSLVDVVGVADGDCSVYVHEYLTGLSLRDVTLGSLVRLHQVKVVPALGRSLHLDSETLIVESDQLSATYQRVRGPVEERMRAWYADPDGSVLENLNQTYLLGCSASDLSALSDLDRVKYLKKRGGWKFRFGGVTGIVKRGGLVCRRELMYIFQGAEELTRQYWYSFIRFSTAADYDRLLTSSTMVVILPLLALVAFGYPSHVVSHLAQRSLVEDPTPAPTFAK
ncbi:hypothetical protein KIPB_006364 [Kipferlia bialata]|uniref:Uncharacterized protein n=1 Tax=Kipferlia bialata TaxID=797122 RepID=A0A9K3CYQ5_9EUKA|nr:hypothetical protein KIPB_006364 [Kipferlia bialata]|eukprot:g6364.t1